MLLVVLVFEGHRVAHWLPQVEQWVEDLGPWGPVLFVGAIIIVEPFFFPNTLFGLCAGVVFGLWAGYAYYFLGVYLANLGVYAIGRRALRGRVLAILETRPSIRDSVRAAEKEGTSLVFWLRMLPINPAIVSYALGAVRTPFRSVAVGTLGMFPHLLFDVYLGTVAAHVTKMAEHGHTDWDLKGAGLVLGLVATGVVTWRIARIARAQIQAAGVKAAP